MRKITLTLFSLCLSIAAVAQTSVGTFKSLEEKNDDVVEITTDKATVQIQFCTPEIVRFRTSWNGNFEENKSLMVSRYVWPKTNFNVEETDASLVFTTDALKVQIQKQPFAVDIYNREGELLNSEKSPNKNLGAFANEEKVGAKKHLAPEEHFFGFGERMDFLDRRGKKVSLDVGRGLGKPHIIGAYNVLEANYAPVPFFMSTKGYGIFLHNSYETHWDMGLSDANSYSFQAEGGELDYYFIYGPKFPKILDGYTSITGKSPLLPKFALGLHVGTYSGGTWGHEEKTSENYPVALVKKFRELEIPIDILHLDSTWRIFGENGGSGATTFEWRETFDNTEQMFDSIYDMNINMMGLHVRPRFDNGNKLRLLDEAREAGHVYPENDNLGEFVNFFDQESVDWWWENGAMNVVKEGAMFFKTDEGSAFGRKANESNKTGPQGKEIESLHNLFPLAYAKAAFTKFQKHNNMRGMNHTREGYAGIQRYPFIWAGDWPSEWQYFEPVIKAGLNMGISGVGYWSHNMGGFEHVADPELYIRWVQFGMFSPIAHLFGMEHPNYKEPWNYGEEAQKIFKQYDELRYSLIPYLYSYSYEMHKTGMPLMRALVLEYQDDPNVYEITDQYLFGDDLMICPVTTKEAKTRTVYLPEGNWINYWTGEKFEGKQYLNVLTPIEEIPIFVKAGAIIPTQEVVKYVGEKEIDEIILDVYPEGESSFKLYDDDGESLEYQNGEFSISEINMTETEDQIKIEINTPEGNFKVAPRNYKLRVHSEKEISEFQINGHLQNDIPNDDEILEISPKQKSDERIEVLLTKKID